MVIGNGFFSNTKDDAVKEMRERSRCDVKHLPFPTIGNIDYFISETGDLYGMQRIQGKCLTRQRRHIRYKKGFTARLATAPHKESFFGLEMLTYCAFVLNRWEPDVQLDFVNGNQYDVRPVNLKPKQRKEHPEWTERMTDHTDIYSQHFMRICYSTAFKAGISMEDSKDIVSQAFIYLCTTGFNPSIKTDDDFVGLWVKVSRMRAIDFYYHHLQHFNSENYDLLLELRGRSDKPYEFDWFKLRPGQKRQTYLRMYFEGNSPTEIAKTCDSSLSTVSSEVTRSVQFMRKYFKRDIEQWNK
jgi:DNA-directed RNA polymerase specialized sigma24 family protein